jgi:hypothetical protein
MYSDDCFPLRIAKVSMIYVSHIRLRYISPQTRSCQPEGFDLAFWRGQSAIFVRRSAPQSPGKRSCIYQAWFSLSIVKIQLIVVTYSWASILISAPECFPYNRTHLEGTTKRLRLHPAPTTTYQRNLSLDHFREVTDFAIQIPGTGKDHNMTRLRVFVQSAQL